MGNCRGLRCTLSVFAALTIAVTLAAQEITIPERVAHGAKGRFSGIPSGKAPSLSDVLSRTDLIVRGIVGDSSAYLSEDLMDVYTDYELKSPVILYQAEPTPAPTPTAARRIIVTLTGGEIMVGNVKYTQYEEALPILQPGIETLFLLQRVGSRYRPTDVYLGAFAISAAKVLPLTRVGQFAEEYRNAPAAEAIAAIVSQIAAARSQRPVK
jgi:hypothetical protein